MKQEKLELKADCSNLGLTRVPQDLNHTIFALDLSKNKIKIIRNNSFERYKQLAVLTIHSNDLYFLDAESFVGLINLVKLSMNNNKLNLSTAYPNGIFSHTPQLKYLDIGSNQGTSHKYKTPMVYPYFGYMKKLQTLNLDLVNHPIFNLSGLYKLKKLETVRFSTCTLENLLNDTFIDMPPSIKQIYLNNCEKVKIVEANFLKPFFNLQVLELCGVFIHLSRALELLYPFQNKNMTSIIFKRVTVDFQDSNKYPYAVRVTREMMKYLQTICVEDLVLAESGIVDFEPGSLLTYNHIECFKRIVFTGNRFSVRDGKSKTMEFITFQSKAINLRIFDYSYNPIKYSNIDYSTDFIQSNRISSFGEYQYETQQHENNPLVVSPNNDQYVPTYTVSLPPNLEALRFSHYLTPTDSRINLMIKRSQNLRHLDVSYFQTTYF
ncbi:LINGO [Mytilus coruscus]|uniref:LINGO n=1 Tax=Mytilus coruscus TaxID=42192 RepID=A0A6J8DGL8_MYTCO|nr:LINGO [Mytilus coruscus]